ncbi:hypothetical protein SAMN05216304_1011041 [Bosea sp. OK403]|uniref:hypothetical protein n=1 Tax=Bosea sp. OK403 TaxID=1855286 RepID=UPI0008EB8298|nr:hypothetical protein [Bosea sp. OK403]SFI13679.1 hypothetical protein SAMN05216304_1011041 [Bosea sp. OK403]
MAYTDELEPLLALEQELRRKIALRIAEEAGEQPGGDPSENQIAVADEVIANWTEAGEEDQDMRAFRPIGPLQQLLADHSLICERILDIRDRRLS